MSRQDLNHSDTERRLQQALVGVREAIAELRVVLAELEPEETGDAQWEMIAAQLGEYCLFPEQ